MGLIILLLVIRPVGREPTENIDPKGSYSGVLVLVNESSIFIMDGSDAGFGKIVEGKIRIDWFVVSNGIQSHEPRWEGIYTIHKDRIEGFYWEVGRPHATWPTIYTRVKR